MPLDLLQIEEVVRHFRDLVQKSLLLGVWLLCFQVDRVHCLAELEKGLVFDPAGVVRQTSLQEVKASYQFIGLCLLNLLQEVGEELNADATYAPNTVRGKRHVCAKYLVKEFRVVDVLGDREQAW